ncbi:MAG: hypothetical protein JW915_10510 [Chitinispirillaceae bacterium]|nr:hypothetical protein [Chitinispirillaceae bacterium]
MIKISMLRIRIALLLVVLIGLSGCSVLTPSQVKEVKKFAAATKSYDTLPGAVTETYGELRKRERLYSAATLSSGPASTSMKQIEGALKVERDAKKRAERADKALNVLNTYAQLLVVLSSDKFTDELQEAAEDLGSKLNDGVEIYNDMTGQSVAGFGGYVSEAIRGIGGLIIRHKQTKVLKDIIQRADPVVAEMAQAVDNYLVNFVPHEEEQGFLLEVENNIKGYFKDSASTIVQKEPLSCAFLTAETLEYSYNAQQLAQQARDAIAKLRKAHADLKSNLKAKSKLKGAIESVKVFVDEVKAADDLRKDLED